MSTATTNTATVELGGRSMVLTWNAPARFRLGTIKGHEDFVGLAYICAIFWAADGSKRWRSPEDLAEHVEAIPQDVVKAAHDALFAAPDEQKKSSSSSGPSPDTTSA